MEEVKKYSDLEIEKCFDDCWNLNKNGDYDIDKRFFIKTVITNGLNPYEVFDKYNEFINAKLPLQDSKYIANEDKIVPIFKFMDMGMYKKSFSPPNRRNIQLEEYLYGIKHNKNDE